MALAINLGFPRIGANRQLKKATEAYWAGRASAEELHSVARTIRRQNWDWQRAAGIDHIPTGDFSLYDHVLDAVWWLDAIPERFRHRAESIDLDRYFAMARGIGGVNSVQALEMTKWFDTNYHYLVPELTGQENFRRVRSDVFVEPYAEARAAGIAARPVILGPLSFLMLSKGPDPLFRTIGLLENILPAYEHLLRELAARGAEWIQIDEPILALEIDEPTRSAFRVSMERLSAAAPPIKIFLATYFDALGDNLVAALQAPINALHLDLVRAPGQLDAALATVPAHLTLSLGLVDGRNVWKTNLERALRMAEKAAARLSPERLMVGPSCSLLHCPLDLREETEIYSQVRDWLAFGLQKLDEIVVLKRALNHGRSAVKQELEENAASIQRRQTSAQVVNGAVRKQVAAIAASDYKRSSPYLVRRKQQDAALGLPVFPTTTIGSFPQTAELRAQRARLKKGEIDSTQYDAYIRHEIVNAVQQQEKIGLDVLVHGEAERNDMVEYFGEMLEGFVFTKQGWVQSYGSRCVKPPIIYGDVTRRRPMTVSWWQFAQSQTERPMKGMLTGPVTILQWSFVRDDQPRKDTCLQLALAIRAETADLENAGCRIIQIDEPALREGLPLHRQAAEEYLNWAVAAFRLASSGVHDSTQIHTHMCYAEFNEIVDSVANMDADVISIESARSHMESLLAFTAERYRNEIGPGVFDIHSPRVPSEEEMLMLARKALQVIPSQRLWINPDCGLKTRRWEEVVPALINMVGAAARLRQVG